MTTGNLPTRWPSLSRAELRELVDGGLIRPSQAVGMMPACTHCGARYTDFAEHCRSVGDEIHIVLSVMSE